MSAFTAGQRIAASWLGAGYQPATVIEANPVTGLLHVQFDDGRDAWIASMNARAAPNAAPAPVAANPQPMSAPVQPSNPAYAAPPAAPAYAPPPAAPSAAPFTPFSPAQSAPAAPPAAPVTPFSPAQSAPAAAPNPGYSPPPVDPQGNTQAMPAAPAGPPGEFRPVQGAPVNAQPGSTGFAPFGASPFGPPDGNKQ